ncbi:MAG TPA: orotate phosphoribosyltransferase [Aggregatilineaceae bacterium]|jgi:orotate phosphoribosyltransferase|nr:orotate phosphoribosyltransferase [Aggregatilineaceae bacterium]
MEQPFHATQQAVAGALLDIGAVVFTPSQPVTFKSGIVAPVYVDNRRLPFWPEQWRVVIDALQRMIARHTIVYDVIAGIEAAGIPHSAALSYAQRRPSVFVRKQAKEHGMRGRVEGGAVEGKRVLLVEDMVTTGGSSLAGVEALREAGAQVEDCLCITSYGFPEAQAAFDAAGVRLHVLAPFAAIVSEAARRGLFSAEELTTIEAWSRDPHGWQAPGAAREE